MEFTPWKRSGDYIQTQDGQRWICKVPPFQDEQAEAYTRIVLAAPDLLEAAKSVLAEYDAEWSIRGGYQQDLADAIEMAEGRS